MTSWDEVYWVRGGGSLAGVEAMGGRAEAVILLLSYCIPGGGRGQTLLV